MSLLLGKVFNVVEISETKALIEWNAAQDEL